ncbi:Transcription factor TFIIE, alpha subunit [Trifolium repens]|nr:Transcription factor TFIIE, alpha subunit [Trifolium repens]
MELSMMILPEKVIINPKREGVITEKLLWFLMPSPEEDLAKDLKLHTKQLRRTMRFFEEEKIITRDHRRECLNMSSSNNESFSQEPGHYSCPKRLRTNGSIHLHHGDRSLGDPVDQTTTTYFPR